MGMARSGWLWRTCISCVVKGPAEWMGSCECVFSDVHKLSGRTNLESNRCVTCLWLAIFDLFDLNVIHWQLGQPALPFGGSRWRKRRWVIHWDWGWMKSIELLREYLYEERGPSLRDGLARRSVSVSNFNSTGLIREQLKIHLLILHYEHSQHKFPW